MPEFISLLGQHRSAPEITAASLKFSLDEVMDDPPFRQYLISRQQGIDLLLENDHVIAVQIFVQATRKFSAFSGKLPDRKSVV